MELKPGQMQTLKEDWRQNRISIKALIIVLFFRLAAWFAQHPNRLVRLIGIPVRVLYKLVIEFLMGVELPDRVRAGPGLAIRHGVGLVVNAQSQIGRNVTLRQNTTIGSKHSGSPSPRIGDGVSVGANCVVIGDIDIGARTVIGAGAIVTSDCPADSTVYGQKAEIASSAEHQAQT